MHHRFAFAAGAALLAAIGSVGAASAADLPRKAPVAAPLAAPVANWTGIYVGVHGGWVWSDVGVGTSFTPPAGAPAPFSFAQDSDGGMLGGQIGFNYQIANWVVGIEADLSWTDVGSTSTMALPPVAAFFVGSIYTTSHDMNWFGTVRGRLGYAAGNLLLYVTGGLAYADIDYSVVATFPAGPATFTGASSAIESGWTIGGGFEWGFAPNWSVKAEYLYYDLGDTTLRSTSPAVPGEFITTSFDNDGHILRLGLNYRFGGGPVVARY